METASPPATALSADAPQGLAANTVGYDNPAVRATLDLPWAGGRL